MNTTFKELVASNLLAVCQETTINMINKIKSTKIDENDPKIKKWKDQFEFISSEHTKQYAYNLFKTIAILTNNPQIELFLSAKDSNNFIYDPFTVAYIIDYTDKNINPKDIFIITNGKEKFILDKNGGTSTLILKHIMPQVRLATPDEIMKCIQELNDAQWKTIMTNELFSPIVNAALNTPVKVSENQINIDDVDDSQG